MGDENESSLIPDRMQSENVLINGYYNINGKLFENYFILFICL